MRIDLSWNGRWHCHLNRKNCHLNREKNGQWLIEPSELDKADKKRESNEANERTRIKNHNIQVENEPK